MLLEHGVLLNKRYRISEILGQGGMGSVYRAIDENLGLEVAVKDNLFTTEEYARQFRREAIILAGLRHPNLPRVTDHFSIRGQGQYLVMDFIEGEDLRERMERLGVLPDEDVVTIGAAVCDALIYLASRNPPIVHRDIKPGNVKITPQGHIFLVDFGLAKTLIGTQETTTGARAMTPGYSPPEQYGTARTDHRSDIYSLGATLYAALTGAIPEDALSRVMDQTKLTPVRQLNPQVSKKLASVMEKALEVRPDDRFQGAEEFKQALLNASSSSRRQVYEYIITPPPNHLDDLAREDISVKPDNEENEKAVDNLPLSQRLSASSSVLSKEPSIKKSFKIIVNKLDKNWLFPIVASLSVVLLIFISYIVVSGQVRSFFGGLNSSQSVLLITDTPEKSTNDEQPTVSLVYTKTTVPATLTPQITPTLRLTEIAEPTETKLPIIEIPVATELPTPSPTSIGGGGGKIAYASASSGLPQIYYFQTNNGIITKVTDMPEGACQPDWSPDGKRLVFTSPCETNKDYYPGSSLYIINVDGSGLLPLPTISAGDFDPAWSPDGKYIVFTSLRNNGRNQLYLFNLEDNTVKVLSEKYSFDMQPAWSKDGKKIIFISTRKGNPQIWVMDADGSNQMQFSRSVGLKNYHPSWTPDGASVIFTQYVADGGVPRVVLAPYDFDNYVEYKLGKDSLPMREAVVSPDGYWIAYEGWQAGTSHDIYIVAISGAGKQKMTIDPRVDFDPVWCPAP